MSVISRLSCAVLLALTTSLTMTSCSIFASPVPLQHELEREAFSLPEVATAHSSGTNAEGELYVTCEVFLVDGSNDEAVQRVMATLIDAARDESEFVNANVRIVVHDANGTGSVYDKKHGEG